MKPLKFIIKAFGVLFLIASVIITGYYYIYQGFFKDKQTELKEERPKVVETIVEEKLEERIQIKDVIKTESTAGKYLSEIFSSGKEGKYEMIFKVKNMYFLNNIFNHNFFQEGKEQEIKITIHKKNDIGDFLIQGKINGRALMVSGKYDSAYVYIDSLVGNGILSMINKDALNYFFDSLGGYIDYGSFNNKKISFVPLAGLDPYIGKSQEGYYTEIFNGLIPLFECNKNECLLTIDTNLVETIRRELDKNKDAFTEKQKISIISLSTRVIDYISGSVLRLNGDNGYHLIITGDKLDFDFGIRFTKEDVNISIDKQSYKEKTQEELLNDFIDRNTLFTSILTNKDITEELLK